jgi:hypothetical protein
MTQEANTLLLGPAIHCSAQMVLPLLIYTACIPQLRLSELANRNVSSKIAYCSYSIWHATPTCTWPHDRMSCHSHESFVSSHESLSARTRLKPEVISIIREKCCSGRGAFRTWLVSVVLSIPMRGQDRLVSILDDTQITRCETWC